MMNPIAMQEIVKVRQREIEAEIKHNRLVRLVSPGKQRLSPKHRLIVGLSSLMLTALMIAQIFVS